MDELEVYFASWFVTFALRTDSLESTLLALFAFATGLDVLNPVFWQLLQVHVSMSQATPMWKQSQYFLRHLWRQTRRISSEQTKEPSIDSLRSHLLFLHEQPSPVFFGRKTKAPGRRARIDLAALVLVPSGPACASIFWQRLQTHSVGSQSRPP